MDVKAEIPSASILIVEDNPQQVWLYEQALRNYRLTCVTTGTAALEALTRTMFDVIILDHILAEGERGLAFIPPLKAIAAHVPIIVISGELDAQSQLQALQGPRSASFMVTKPVDLDELVKVVEIALTECGMGEALGILQSLERAENIEPGDPDRRYLARLVRQHEMLKRLRASSEPANISELSREFGVARRTIARDLRELIQRGQLTPAHVPEWDQEATDE
jgi:CheY-like chemotaxis protein